MEKLQQCEWPFLYKQNAFQLKLIHLRLLVIKPVVELLNFDLLETSFKRGRRYRSFHMSSAIMPDSEKWTAPIFFVCGQHFSLCARVFYVFFFYVWVRSIVLRRFGAVVCIGRFCVCVLVRKWFGGFLSGISCIDGARRWFEGVIWYRATFYCNLHRMGSVDCSVLYLALSLAMHVLQPFRFMVRAAGRVLEL